MSCGRAKLPVTPRDVSVLSRQLCNLKLPPREARLVPAEVKGLLLDATSAGMAELCMIAAGSLPARASPHRSQGAGWGSAAYFRCARGETRAQGDQVPS